MFVRASLDSSADRAVAIIIVPSAAAMAICCNLALSVFVTRLEMLKPRPDSESPGLESSTEGQDLHM